MILFSDRKKTKDPFALPREAGEGKQDNLSDFTKKSV